MTDPVIHGLSNEAYHHEHPYSEYLSSSQLKRYAVSPKAFKFALDNPTEEKSDALRFGSLFHDLMACLAEFNGDWGKGFFKWKDDIAIFDPPVNPKTNTYYGATTKAYTEAYEKFLSYNQSKTVAHVLETDLAGDMADALLNCSGATSEQVRKLLKWGKPEVSHFIEYEGLKFKWRPDLETPHKIIDYKTIASDDLSERSINSQIAKYGYDISAAHYLFFDHMQTGKWKRFYWIFVSKVPPHDAIMVDASKWTYDYDPETDIVMPQVGAIKFKALLDLHIQCSRKNEWPGSEIFIPQADNGLRIMCPTPPPWEVSNAANLLEQSFNE
jgi:hypothetical protein